jgi:hypothetical protein
MRMAYSGRAAAFEKKGDYERALTDHQMVVMFYALELEILTSLGTPKREKFVAEAAQAYLSRGKCLQALGRQAAAQLDRKRAEVLQATTKKLADQAASTDAPPTATVEVVNSWTADVTLVIDGVSYLLKVGEQKVISVRAVSVSCEIQTGASTRNTTLQAGKSYTIR